MNVGFYLAGARGDRFEGYRPSDPMGHVFAHHLVASIRRAMPEVEITQLTDDKAAPIWGIDHVRRLPAGPLAEVRSRHQSELEGDWLFIDSDCVIEQDVRHVFQCQFDIAVTDRQWRNPPPPRFQERMPYCAGVVFSRCRAFWVDVHQQVLAMKGSDREWFGDQIAIGQILQSGKYRKLELPGALYQQPPETPDEDLSGVLITHYKGERRKPMLLTRIHRESGMVIA